MMNRLILVLLLLALSCSCLFSKGIQLRTVNSDSMKVRFCGLLQDESRDSLLEAYRIASGICSWPKRFVLDTPTSNAAACTIAFRDPEIAGADFSLISLRDSTGIEHATLFTSAPQLNFPIDSEHNYLRGGSCMRDIIVIEAGFVAFDGYNSIWGSASVSKVGNLITLPNLDCYGYWRPLHFGNDYERMTTENRINLFHDIISESTYRYADGILTLQNESGHGTFQRVIH